MKYDVFISYSHEDRIIAEGICGFLESQKIRCWIDYRDLPKGRAFSMLIPSSIKNSSLLLAVFSKDFNTSKHTDREISIAAENDIPVLVFRLTEDKYEGTKEYYLSQSNWIEAFPEPEKCFGELYNNICLLLGIQNESSIPIEEVHVDTQSFKQDEELVQKGLAELRKIDGDKEMAAYYIRKAAKNGFPEAEYLLGRIYCEGRGLPHNWNDAFRWLSQAAEHGNAKAMFFLGRFYHYGINIERNTMRALELYTKSADLGYGGALKELGRVFHTGELGPQDEKRSVAYYEKAFDILYENAMGANDADCQEILGSSFLDGNGVTKSYQLAIKLYQKAAGNYNADGYNSLGYCYGSGLGVKESQEKSHEYTMEAAKLGLPLAMSNIAKDYLNGRGVEKNLDEYHKWVYQAAECGSHTALYEIGIDFIIGEICEKNITKASKWLKEAMNSGSLQAMTMLGLLYENEDIEVDEGKQKAFNLYKQAAISGHFSAYIYLGNCYFNGVGTEENDIEAERWYLKIAEEYEKMAEAEEYFITEYTGAGNCHLIMLDNYKEQFVDVFKNLVWIYRNSKKVAHNEELARKFERIAFELNPDDKQLENNIASSDNLRKIEEAAKNGDAEALDKLLTSYDGNKEQIEKWATFAINNMIFVSQRDYMSGIDHIDMILTNAKVENHAIYTEYIKNFIEYARQSEKYNNCYSLFNAACEEYKAGFLKLSNEELDFIRKDAHALIDDVFCAGYLRKRKEHFDILFPDYLPERILNGDFSNERDFKLFYAEKTIHKGDNIITDLALKDIFKPMSNDISYGEIISKENKVVVNAGDFVTAIRDLTSSYNAVCKDNPQIVKEHIDEFKFEMLVPVCSPEQMQRFGMQALKALISVRSLFEEQWDNILSNYDNLDKMLDVAEVTKDQNLQLFLIEYVELQIELDSHFEYAERLQTMYLDNNKQGIADELNAYVDRLNNESIEHNLPYFTTENLPAGSYTEEDVSHSTSDENDIKDPEAQNQMGEDYYYGQNGKEKDYVKAAKWYRKAAEQGHMYAQYSLAWCYDKGIGVTALPVEAAKWYRKAAEQGHAASQCSLGLCYETGEGVIKELNEAVNWYRKAAEQDYPAAQCNLGFCYKNGIGVKQDEAEAFVWFKKAAQQESARAQSLLGDCYFYGQGVERDATEAVYWFTKSAEQDYPYGQYNLAWCYEKGVGIKADIEKARELYKKAADNGHKEALKELERLNANNNIQTTNSSSEDYEYAEEVN